MAVQDKKANPTNLSSPVLRVEATNPEPWQSVVAMLSSAQLQGPDGQVSGLISRPHRLEWDVIHANPMSYLAAAPVGTYQGLLLAVLEVVFVERGGNPRPRRWENPLMAI